MLRFRRDGSFRILMMSDIQEPYPPDPRTVPAMERLIERAEPDLVVLGGDNCDGHAIRTREEFSRYLDVITAPMERRGIAWMHLFGNHDHDLPMDDREQTEMYEAYGCCVSGHTDGVYGAANYVVPVYGAGEEPAFLLWALDTNNRYTDAGLPLHPGFDRLRRPATAGWWDILHFDQLMWYWNASREAERRAGRPVPGVMFMHMPPYEFQYLADNPAETGRVGHAEERMWGGPFNPGLFAAVLQRGDVRCIACGHSHENDFAGTFCGVLCCTDACTGYSPYGVDERRGGRLFVLHEDDPARVETKMLRHSEGEA